MTAPPVFIVPEVKLAGRYDEVSSSRAPAKFLAVMRCPVGSRNFVPRLLAVEPPTVGKNMRAARPHTLRQVRVTCTSATKFAVFIRIVWCRCFASMPAVTHWENGKMKDYGTKDETNPEKRCQLFDMSRNNL